MVSAKYVKREQAPCEDLAGQTFGYLTVIERCDYSMCGAVWRCRCACGTLTDARATALRNGKRISCGCRGRGLK